MFSWNIKGVQPLADKGADVLFIAHPNTTSLVLLRLLLFSFF